MSSHETEFDIHFVGNRFNNIFERALDFACQPTDDTKQRVVLTYWDTYFGQLPALDDWMKQARVLRLIDKAAINPLSNKKSMPKMLVDAGKSHVAPETYVSIEEALAHAGDEVSIWFFKNAYGTGGKNMFCVSTDDLPDTELPNHYVIQAGVADLALIEGKKFTTRIYILIWDGRVFLYDNGFLMIHGAKYEETNTDYGVQIEHSGYDKPDSPIKMKQLIHYSEYMKFKPRFVELLKEIDPIFDVAKGASDIDSYIFLGIDVLLQLSGDVKLIEINTFPNFRHTPEITEEVNVPFFVAAIETMLGCDVDSLQEI